ncbi:MAG TPA: maleylpyruvate isomerase N-terminal domain-containing protein [Actinomycetes bacterium]|nr:maleylpyruvate isomerase N-terminal domain-containing protein [Actinomycetes bacterium]
MRGPTAADLQTTLARQVETLAARVKPYAPPDWAAPSARPGATNADVLAALAALLDALAQGVELRDKPTRPQSEPPRRPSDAGLSVVLSSIGGRLVDLLRSTDAAALVWHPRFRFSARTMSALALAEVVLHRWDVTGPGDRGPEPRAARLVLQGLFASRDDSGASPVALLLHLTGRARIEGRPGWGGDGWGWEFPDEAVDHRAEDE